MVYKIYRLCKSTPCRTRDVIVLGYLHPLRGTRLRLGSGRSSSASIGCHRGSGWVWKGAKSYVKPVSASITVQSAPIQVASAVQSRPRTRRFAITALAKRRPVYTQPFPGPFVVGIRLRHEAPVVARVVELAQVHQLVNHDVALVHESELARNDPHPEAPHLPISYDSGPPRSVIRFRMLHASSASALCPPGVRARRPVPMIDLYLKKAFSTRACRW